MKIHDIFYLSKRFLYISYRNNCYYLFFKIKYKNVKFNHKNYTLNVKILCDINLTIKISYDSVIEVNKSIRTGYFE